MVQEPFSSRDAIDVVSGFGRKSQEDFLQS
jgi:hypothetical protein